ncbi:hypothetical protein ACFSUS_18285 [Spirosoma soli]|uniref:Uncharacterized protein n=1 Tax=Spirosoma soli TaxID=1770529 RepID=A0ABW5M871_9BACT
MPKLPWAKYLFSIWGVAILITLTAKFITTNVLILAPLSVGLYWLLVKSFAKIRGYQ